jgi:hypothetical protein
VEFPEGLNHAIGQLVGVDDFIHLRLSDSNAPIMPHRGQQNAAKPADIVARLDSTGGAAMLRTFLPRLLLPLVALGLAGLLGGCVAYPAYDGGYYGAPYYAGPPVVVGGGWGYHGHRHRRGW